LCQTQSLTLSRRMKSKVLSKTERKILIFNKVHSGMSYENAKAEVDNEIGQVRENNENEAKNGTIRCHRKDMMNDCYIYTRLENE